MKLVKVVGKLLPLLVGVEQFAMDAIPQCKKFRQNMEISEMISKANGFEQIYIFAKYELFSLTPVRREIEPQAYNSHQIVSAYKPCKIRFRRDAQHCRESC